MKIVVVPNGKKGYIFHIDTFHDGVENIINSANIKDP